MISDILCSFIVPLNNTAQCFVTCFRHQMAQFINLPDAMLEAFLQKYREEEEAEIREINNK